MELHVPFSPSQVCVIDVARLITFYVRGQVMWATRTSIVVSVAMSSAKTLTFT